jgi:hypothetical protein
MVRVVLISLYMQSFFLDILYQKQLWLFLGVAFGLAASQRAVSVVAPERMSSPPIAIGLPVLERHRPG